MVKEIKIKNIVCLVDNEDYDKLSKYRWYIDNNKKGYCRPRTNLKKGEISKYRKQPRMHQLILEIPKNKICDHINGNPFDNRKENLRICSSHKITKIQKNILIHHQRYKGVRWIPDRKKWRTEITLNKKHIFLGYFGNEEEAGKRYNEEAKKLFGDFANINFLGVKK